MPYEYLFAVSFTVADRAARKQGWRPYGRTQWNKPDGTVICFICLEEQLTVVPAEATLHVVGEAPASLRRLKCRLMTLAV